MDFRENLGEAALMGYINKLSQDGGNCAAAVPFSLLKFPTVLMACFRFVC